MVDHTEEHIVVPVNRNESKPQSRDKIENEFALEDSGIIEEGLIWSDIGEGEFS